MNSDQVRQILVLGGGTAGLLAAITLKTRHPLLDVTLVHSPEIGTIGVGEGSTIPLVTHLHDYLRIAPEQFYALAQPTWKLGIHFKWGSRGAFNYTFDTQTDWKWNDLSKFNGYYCGESFDNVTISSALMKRGKAFERLPNGDPQITRALSYHMETKKLEHCLQTVARDRGVSFVEDTVLHVECGQNGIDALVLSNHGRRCADLFIDCSGFRSELLGKALETPFRTFRSSLFCNRAIVGGWVRDAEPILPYTIAETMKAGWCWQIEHEHRVNRGYVYSAEFISDEEAEREYRTLNPKVQDTRVIKFPSGCRERMWVKNVVAIGNASGFVEPLEATAIGTICSASRLLAEGLAECDCSPTETVRKAYNAVADKAWTSIRRFLAVHYKFNRKLDTPFWRAVNHETDLHGAEDVVAYYKENGPGVLGRMSILDPLDMFGIEGYLTMLVGMGVEHRKPYTPTPNERTIWNSILAEHEARAANGLSVDEALGKIRSPEWQWNPDFYGRIEHLSAF